MIIGFTIAPHHFKSWKKITNANGDYMYSNTEYTKKQVITVVIVAEEWSTEFTSKA